MRIGLVGGGSGGHFYPLIAVTEELAKYERPIDLYYFGPSPYNPDILAKYGIRHSKIPAGKLRRYLSFQNIVDVFRTISGFFVAVIKLYIIYPDVLFSKGGYTSVPVLMAARFLRIPVVIHESDVLPGKANKLAASFAKYIAISWPDTSKYFPKEKIALTGIPIRTEIKNIHQNPHQILGIPDDLPFIYVTGGSLGAQRVNNLILDSLNELLPTMRIYHQTGLEHEERVKTAARELLVDTPELLDNYYISGNLPGEKVAALLDAADIVITRAGSTTLHEIAIHNKPAIVIPIPEEVSHDQRTNAYAYAESGGASVLEEHNLTANLLKTEIHSILNDQNRYQHMQEAVKSLAQQDAAQIIATQLINIGEEHGS